MWDAVCLGYGYTGKYYFKWVGTQLGLPEELEVAGKWGVCNPTDGFGVGKQRG
jgi:hypothetical protein